MEANEKDRSIIAAIIAMGQALNLRTVAEGVETEGQQDFPCKQGCSEAQGYMFGRPIPAEEFLELITSLEENNASLPG